MRHYGESWPISQARSQGNVAGLGLCLRSLGELALLAGAVSEARTCWRGAHRYLAGAAGREAEQLEGWLELMQSA